LRNRAGPFGVHVPPEDPARIGGMMFLGLIVVLVGLAGFLSGLAFG